MARVHFTPALQRFAPQLAPIEIDGGTVQAIVAGLRARHPALMDYVLEENGALRRHVNIFINDSFIRDRKALSDIVTPTDKIYIIQALSGG